MAHATMVDAESVNDVLASVSREGVENIETAAPAIPLLFSRLPREIRDLIYQYAYGHEKDGAFKMVSNIL